jgi:hypothetical protein
LRYCLCRPPIGGAFTFTPPEKIQKGDFQLTLDVFNALLVLLNLCHNEGNCETCALREFCGK